MLDNAKNAVRALLSTGIEFNLTGSKEDSGSLAIHLLKKRNPTLSDIDIIKNNIDNLSIDSCMSVLSSPCYLNEELNRVNSIYDSFMYTINNGTHTRY
jgi:hypothetical protein